METSSVSTLRKVCPQCSTTVHVRRAVCGCGYALYNADRVNFKSRNYHVVAYNISILAKGLHFSALVVTFPGLLAKSATLQLFQAF